MVRGRPEDNDGVRQEEGSVRVIEIDGEDGRRVLTVDKEGYVVAEDILVKDDHTE